MVGSAMCFRSGKEDKKFPGSVADSCGNHITPQQNLELIRGHGTVKGDRLLTTDLLNRVYPAFENIVKKPTDLDLYCFQITMWIDITNLDQGFWLADN